MAARARSLAAIASASATPSAAETSKAANVTVRVESKAALSVA